MPRRQNWPHSWTPTAAVNGRDLMAAGIPAGPGLRRTLEALLDSVIRGQLPNEQQRLLDAAGQISAS